jgi:hypothetical protein
VIAEQRHPALLDHRQLIAPVVDDEDGDLGHLLRPGAGSRESAAEVGEHLAGLDRQVTGTYEVPVGIFGFLAGASTGDLPQTASVGPDRPDPAEASDRQAPAAWCPRRPVGDEGVVGDPRVAGVVGADQANVVGAEYVPPARIGAGDAAVSALERDRLAVWRPRRTTEPHGRFALQQHALAGAGGSASRPALR